MGKLIINPSFYFGNTGNIQRLFLDRKMKNNLLSWCFTAFVIIVPIIGLENAFWLHRGQLKVAK